MQMRTIPIVVISPSDQVTSHCYKHIHRCRWSINQAQPANYASNWDEKNQSQIIILLLKTFTCYYRAQPYINHNQWKLSTDLTDKILKWSWTWSSQAQSTDPILLSLRATSKASIDFSARRVRPVLSIFRMQFHFPFSLCISN